MLSLSPYLELRERFPYLTHSCKSQLNSSNSENELQTRLLSIWAQGSCQGWGRLRDHPSAQIYWPHHLRGLQRTPALLPSLQDTHLTPSQLEELRCQEVCVFEICESCRKHTHLKNVDKERNNLTKTHQRCNHPFHVTSLAVA